MKRIYDETFNDWAFTDKLFSTGERDVNCEMTYNNAVDAGERRVFREF